MVTGTSSQKAKWRVEVHNRLQGLEQSYQQRGMADTQYERNAVKNRFPSTEHLRRGRLDTRFLSTRVVGLRQHSYRSGDLRVETGTHGTATIRQPFYSHFVCAHSLFSGKSWLMVLSGEQEVVNSVDEIDTNPYVCTTYEVGDYVLGNTLSRKSVTATQKNTVHGGEAHIS